MTPSTGLSGIELSKSPRASRFGLALAVFTFLKSLKVYQSPTNPFYLRTYSDDCSTCLTACVIKQDNYTLNYVLKLL